ncbi:hypothetical protein AABB24_026113 [Solanum stoloniferum]|uniref:Uncharacterized protein n=1 Tax=Solanum stoloniferum TaxID=62892 RepID=A0ABD2SDK3_9SOLN
MDLEKKIWAAFAVLFFTVGIAALGHTAWLVCTVIAILLGGLFVVHGFLPVLNIGPPTDADDLDIPGMVAFFIFAHPLSILQKNNPHVDVPLFVLMSTASYFCVLMMVRPLATDFGILHGLCDMTVFLAKEYGTGRQTWLAFCLCTLMIFLRLIMERRAVVHVAARRD